MAIRIFIDQGHNPSGPNTGAEGNGLIEQDITYTVGLYLAELLRADPRFEVRLSRSSPGEILGTSNATSLAARVQAANDWPADYFISIHCNANENPAVNGTEVYVYRENTQAYWLAQHVLNGIVQRTRHAEQRRARAAGAVCPASHENAGHSGRARLSDQRAGCAAARDRPLRLRAGHHERHP